MRLLISFKPGSDRIRFRFTLAAVWEIDWSGQNYRSRQIGVEILILEVT